MRGVCHPGAPGPVCVPGCRRGLKNGEARPPSELSSEGYQNAVFWPDFQGERGARPSVANSVRRCVDGHMKRQENKGTPLALSPLAPRGARGFLGGVLGAHWSHANPRAALRSSPSPREERAGRGSGERGSLSFHADQQRPRCPAVHTLTKCQWSSVGQPGRLAELSLRPARAESDRIRPDPTESNQIRLDPAIHQTPNFVRDAVERVPPNMSWPLASYLGDGSGKGERGIKP